MKNRIFLKLFLLFTSSFLLITCEESTKPETVTFSGTVTLEGETDHSGVKVSLYKPVELDTALVRINQQYPNIGVQISQETEFDHREHTPLYSTTTNASGAWEIKDVTPGTYNVVTEKDSFGWEYNFDSNNSQTSFTLYKVTELSGIISNSVNLMENHHYLITNDLIINSNATLNVNAGVWLRFNGFYRIDINGTLTISGNDNNFVKITTNEDSLIQGKWRFIEGNSGSNTNVSHFILKYSKNGIRLNNVSSAEISHSKFESNTFTGIFLNSVVNSRIENCLFKNNEQSVLTQYCSDIVMEKSIFTQNQEGIKLEYSDNTIEKNYFYNNFWGIYSQHRPSSVITHNQFDDNELGSYCAGSDPIYRANNFYRNPISIWVGSAYFSVDSEPIINFNNFENNDFAVKMTGSRTGQNIHDIDASNNWWGTTINLFINDLIWDKHDEGADSVYTGEINFIPYASTNIDTSGIVNP